MPVQKVIKDGKVYYRWGESGKLYPTKEQAATQGVAITLSQKKRGKR